MTFETCTFLLLGEGMSEKSIEHRLVVMVERAGGMAPKFVSPGMAGMPDRIVLMPGGMIGFVEVKTPGKKPRKLQLRRHVLLQNLGFQLFVLDDPEEIPGIISAIKEGKR